MSAIRHCRFFVITFLLAKADVLFTVAGGAGSAGSADQGVGEREAYFCLLSIGLRRHICDPGVGEREAGAGVATAGERGSD